MKSKSVGRPKKSIRKSVGRPRKSIRRSVGRPRKSIRRSVGRPRKSIRRSVGRPSKSKSISKSVLILRKSKSISKSVVKSRKSNNKINIVFPDKTYNIYVIYKLKKGVKKTWNDYKGLPKNGVKFLVLNRKFQNNVTDGFETSSVNLNKVKNYLEKLYKDLYKKEYIYPNYKITISD